MRPNENVHTQNECCFCSNDLPVEREAYSIDVFLNGLAASQRRRDPPNIPTV